MLKFIATTLAVSTLTIAAHARTPQIDSLFPGVSVRTHFAHDYGDLLSAVEFEGQSYSVAEAARVILPRFGWSDSGNRVRLGSAWVEDLLLYGSEVVKPDSERAGPGGQGPVAEILPDGTFRYTAQAISLRGREPGSVATRWQVEIDPEGNSTMVNLDTVDRHRPEPAPIAKLQSTTLASKDFTADLPDGLQDEPTLSKTLQLKIDDRAQFEVMVHYDQLTNHPDLFKRVVLEIVGAKPDIEITADFGNPINSGTQQKPIMSVPFKIQWAGDNWLRANLWRIQGDGQGRITVTVADPAALD